MFNNLIIITKRFRNHLHSNKMFYCPQFKFIAIVPAPMSYKKGEVVLSVMQNKTLLLN